MIAWTELAILFSSGHYLGIFNRFMIRLAIVLKFGSVSIKTPDCGLQELFVSILTGAELESRHPTDKCDKEQILEFLITNIYYECNGRLTILCFPFLIFSSLHS